MTQDYFLNIFPPGSLSASVITTVWVGITVSVFFNLRFGWSLSGLVVPGYLVPLLIIRPWSAGVVVAEGVLAYFLILWIFEYASSAGLWNSVFGRDRFFALLLASVIVRLLLDGWLLPVIGEAVNSRFGIRFDYRNQLYSFGLIIVALIANQFWKPGFFRGTVPLFITVGVTWLIVRYGLMAFTNFSISNLGYMYEDIATSMLAAPKAYIILLTTACIASHMNLHYGWEYSGILIPSLIALLWYQPLKIAASFAETFAVLAMAALILRLPVFRKTTIEGGRKILLFFNISYGYKFILAYVILFFRPEMKITDAYGFGYLLPCLLAIRMYDREIAARITRTTVQTSLTAIVFASIAGFGLTLISPDWFYTPSPVQAAKSMIVREPEIRLADRIREEKVLLYRGRLKKTAMPPTPRELGMFSLGIRNLFAYSGKADAESLLNAGGHLAEAGFAVSFLENRYFYLHAISPETFENPEKDRNKSRGIFVIDTRAESRMTVEVPSPVFEKGAVEAGVGMFMVMKARALAVAGSEGPPASEGPADASADLRTFFHAFHQAASRSDVIQVRGYTPRSLRVLTGQRYAAEDIELTPPDSVLWVHRSLPPGLKLKRMEEIIGDYRIRWESPPTANVQRTVSRGGFAELYLRRKDIRKFYFRPRFTRHEVPMKVHEQRIDGYLREWLFSDKRRIAEKGSGRYRPPRMEELLFFDEEVLTPLFRVKQTEYRNGEWTGDGLEELRAVSASAAVMGYSLIRYRHRISGQDYLLLMETAEAERRRFWGTYVIRLGRSRGYEIQIPRPLFELNVFEFGVSLFERLQASSLVISGTHKEANIDGSADMIRMRNKENLFNLFHQVFLREHPDTPILTLQTRALGISEARPFSGGDILISFRDGLRNPELLSPAGKRILNHFQADHLLVRFVDGSPETAGYEVGGMPQSLYLDQTAGKEFAVLWITPEVRFSFRQQTDNRIQDRQFNALSIPTVRDYLHPYLTETCEWETGIPVPGGMQEWIRAYTRHRDIVILKKLRSRWPEWELRRFIDRDSHQAFLMVYHPSSRLILAANLSPLARTRPLDMAEGGSPSETVTRFIETRSPRLTHGGRPKS